MSDAESRAAHARMLLDDPMLAEAFETVRQGAVNAWIATGTQDQQAREVAWLTVKVVDRVRGVLQSAVDDGVIAATRAQAPLR